MKWFQALRRGAWRLGLRRPRVHGFVFSWKGYEEKAAALERILGAWIDVTVINSEEGLVGRRPNWVHLDDTAYFSAQWNAALSRFNGDLLFHVQADASLEGFEVLLARAIRLFSHRRVGIYEPHVDYSAFQYDRSQLRSVEREVFEVPMTDCTCWCIHGDIVRQLPAVDTSINRYGWGICAVVAAVSRRQGRLCVRDYAFTVRHPQGRGYPSDVARQERVAYMKTLPPYWAAEMARLYRRLEQVRIRLS